MRDKFCLMSTNFCFALVSWLFFCVVFYLFFFYFYHRGDNERKVRFFKRNVALYLRVSLWLDRFNDFNEFLMAVTRTITNILMICRKKLPQKPNKQTTTTTNYKCMQVKFVILLFIIYNARLSRVSAGLSTSFLSVPL